MQVAADDCRDSTQTQYERNRLCTPLVSPIARTGCVGMLSRVGYQLKASQAENLAEVYRQPWPALKEASAAKLGSSGQPGTALRSSDWDMCRPL